MKFLHARRRHADIRDQNELLGREQRDRCEIAFDVERKAAIEIRVDDERRTEAPQQRVSVRLRLGDDLGRDVAGRTGPIVHDHRLPDELTEMRCQMPGQRVGPAARRERDDEPHRTVERNLRRRGGTGDSCHVRANADRKRDHSVHGVRDACLRSHPVIAPRRAAAISAGPGSTIPAHA